MAVGISVTNVANNMLNWLRNVAPPAVPALWAQLHIGDPGAFGTANPSVVTTRIQVTLTAASGGAVTLNTVSGSWTMTATETISHISIKDASSGGNFLLSGALASSKNVVAGDTLTLTVLNISHTPLAA
jgi:hypothetical protein